VDKKSLAAEKKAKIQPKAKAREVIIPEKKIFFATLVKKPLYWYSNLGKKGIIRHGKILMFLFKNVIILEFASSFVEMILSNYMVLAMA